MGWGVGSYNRSEIGMRGEWWMGRWVDPERNILEDACVYLIFHLFQVFNTGRLIRPTQREKWMNQSWSSTHICNHALDHFNLTLLLSRVIMSSWVFFALTFQLLTPRGNMTLCLDHSTLSPLQCSKTQNVQKKVEHGWISQVHWDFMKVTLLSKGGWVQ